MPTKAGFRFAGLLLLWASLLTCDGGGTGPSDGGTGPSYDLLSILTTSLPDGVVGTAYSQTLTATGGDGSYTWSISAGSLPAGLSLSAGGVISGTPTTASTSNFTVQVASGGATDTLHRSITIANPALSITTGSLADGVVGTAYSQTLEATGGDGSYTWVLNGSLPAGLMLNSDGTLSGTPTAVGTSTFTVQVASGGDFADKGLSITIAFAGSYVSVLSWGGNGTMDGKFGEAGGVAIDAQGTIWVADVMNENIQQFDASGNFLNKFISSIETGSTYLGPTHIGFTDAGDLYAASTHGYWVARYDTSGNEEYLGSFFYGLSSMLDFAVDPRNGDFYLVFWGAIGKVGGGEVLWSRELNDLQTVTVDSQGNVYVLAYPGIQKYDADGNLVAELDLGGEASSCSGCALDVDSSDRLYFLSTAYEGTYVKVFDGSLNLLETFGVDAYLWGYECGLGVAGDGQFLYISINVGYSAEHHNTVLKLERR